MRKILFVQNIGRSFCHSAFQLVAAGSKSVRFDPFKKLAFLTELRVFVEVKVIQVTHAEVVVAM